MVLLEALVCCRQGCHVGRHTTEHVADSCSNFYIDQACKGEILGKEHVDPMSVLFGLHGFERDHVTDQQTQ